MFQTFLSKTIATVSLGGLIAGCALSQAAETQKPPTNDDQILVVYYSWSGNTKAIAEKIHATTGGTFFEIVPENAYPEDYRKCVEQAKREIQQKLRPPLKAIPQNLANYSIIFVGSPNWFGTYAPPIATLLDNPDFAGKTIVPFFTHGGGGMQHCETDIRKQLKNSTILKALTLNGKDVKNPKTQQTIDRWLQEIGIATEPDKNTD